MRSRRTRADTWNSSGICVIFWSSPGLPVASLKVGTPILLMDGSLTVPWPNVAVSLLVVPGVAMLGAAVALASLDKLQRQTLPAVGPKIERLRHRQWHAQLQQPRCLHRHRTVAP